MDYIKMIRSKVGHDMVFLNCVGAAIFNEEGKVLLQKRSDNNRWGFPGGVMELGESFEEALKREVFEETGLCVGIRRLIGIYSKYTDKYPNGDQAQPIVQFFLCDVIGGTLNASDEETSELAFFDLNEAPELFNLQHRDALHDLKVGSDDVMIR
ncbi:MAG: NUDIX hydrolase [Oscillospiraceae bacterium]|jgi:8-oxo-dGTP pyrophosphatase MutT (NUDIX family)|nr:NUDIX hydrolase [Oscillospiraceae bacterium]